MVYERTAGVAFSRLREEVAKTVFLKEDHE
jgi:hypothetical protein